MSRDAARRSLTRRSAHCTPPFQGGRDAGHEEGYRAGLVAMVPLWRMGGLTALGTTSRHHETAVASPGVITSHCCVDR